MKFQIFNRSLLLGMAATCCCCLALLTPEPVAGSQFAITGQFMGSKNIDGEQLLLFKLPKSISPHVEEHLTDIKQLTLNSIPDLQEQQQDTHLQSVRMVYKPSHYPNLNYRTAAAKLLQPPTAPSELSLSLATIPEQVPSSTGYVYSTMPQLVVRRPAAARAEPATLADILSFAESNNNAALEAIEQIDISNQTSLGSTGASANEERQQQEVYLEPLSVDQMSPVAPVSANLTDIEAQLRQLLLRRQTESYSNSSSSPEALLANRQPAHNGTSQEPSQQEWRSEAYPQRHHTHAQPANLTTLNSASPQQQVPSGGILGKLASSSPELLLRLRSLLHRAAQYSHPTGLYNPDNSQQVAGPSNSSGSGEEAGRKYAGQQLQQAHDKGLLDSFLTSQNLSSHDEIKIPLVVIAMPRIISLKRNQYGANQARQGASGSSETGAAEDTQAITAVALRQLLSDLAANAASMNMTQSALTRPPAAPTARLQHPASLHHHLPGALASLQTTSQERQQQAHQYLATGEPERPLATSLLAYQGTMAPYARHFSDQAARAYQHQLYQPRQQGDIDRSHLAGHLTNLTSGAAATTLTSPSLLGSSGQLLYPGLAHTSRLHFEPSNTSHALADNHLSSSLGRLFGGAQQAAAAAAAAASQQRLTADLSQLNVEQQQQQQQVNMAISGRGRQPALTQEAASVYAPDHSLYYPATDAAPLPQAAFLSYLGPQARFNLTTALHNYGHPQLQGQQQLLMRPPASQASVAALNGAIDELAAAQNRDSLLVEQHRLSRLRPLLRAGATTATSKLSSRQMLSLASLAARHDQQDTAAAAATGYSWQQQLSARPPGNKSPGMMLMIM